MAVTLTAKTYAYSTRGIRRCLPRRRRAKTQQLDGKLTLTAFGASLLLGGTGFSIGWVSEFYSVSNSKALQGTYSRGAYTGTGVLEESQKNSRSEDSLDVRKDIIGLGYTMNFASDNSFRFELSYEKMPPLTKVQGYSDGELFRTIAEANFWLFRLGTEYIRKSGYYVAPHNLISYFYKIDHLSDDPVDEINFFGGLKVSQGHTFSFLYSRSKDTVREKLTLDSDEQNVSRSSKKVGLSYGYYF